MAGPPAPKRSTGARTTSRWLPANPLNIYSIDRRTKIKLPPAIHRATGVRQTLTVPSGHDIVKTVQHQKIDPFRVLPYGHTNIDEAPEWFTLVKNELEFELRSEPEPTQP